MSPTSAAFQAAYRYEWALFVDWCAAIDTAPLPASSVVLAEFLGENPASDAVQRRRVAAIDRHHRAAGLPPPGLVTSIRVALDHARMSRIERSAPVDGSLAAALPSSGSVAALFGRRDAVLLLLTGSGLSYRAVAALDRSLITTDGGDLWVGGDHQVRIAEAVVPEPISPADMWERWHTVLEFSDRHPSTAALLRCLQEDTFPDETGAPSRSGPVAVPIDRWGHMPYPAMSMTPAAIAGVVDAHRGGRSPRHATALARRTRESDRSEPDTALNPVVVEQDPVILDSGYYHRGIDARRTAHTLLADVSELADDIDDRIEQLLQRTLDLLGDSATR